MKPKLHLQIAATLCLLIVSLAATFAQGGPGAPGAPNPNTGVPSPPPKPWKDPDWKDPNITLTNVNYDNLPLGEIVRDLRKQFNDAFDLLIPDGWADPNPYDPAARPFNPHLMSINLQLRNVCASEVFNAMNLLFETENDPLRWELRMNGKRPVALLRMIPELLPRTASPFIDPNTGLPVQAPEPRRMIHFVGDLIGDGKSGGMTMEQIVKTVSEVWQMAYGQPGAVQFHKDAQLLIVSGTPEQTDFIQQTIRELRTKVELERKSEPKPVEARPKPEPKPGGPAGSR
jgi:hypothetical protein